MDRSKRRFATRLAGAILAGLALGTATASALAQTYPSRPIRIVVPFPPGGPTDMVTRLYADQLTRRLGQQVVVDNRAGAGGGIGAEAVARSVPDGYTLLLGTAGTHTANMFLFKNVPYDPVKDFTPISLMSLLPSALSVNPALPVQTVGELVAYSKAHPNALNYSTEGPGTLSHLGGEMLKRMSGLDMTHIAYRGAAPAVTALVAGEVQVALTGVLNPIQFARDGKVRILAVATPQRLLALPEIPTIAESGYPDYDVSSWTALFGPAGVQPDIATRLSQEIATIARLPEITEKLLAGGQQAITSTPAELAGRLVREAAKWQAVVKSSGITLE